MYKYILDIFRGQNLQKLSTSRCKTEKNTFNIVKNRRIYKCIQKYFPIKICLNFFYFNLYLVVYLSCQVGSLFLYLIYFYKNYKLTPIS